MMTMNTPSSETLESGSHGATQGPHHREIGDVVAEPLDCCQVEQAADGGRRLMLKGIIALFAIVWAALPLGVVLRYLWPKTVEVVTVKEMVLGKLADFPPGTAKNFQFGSLAALFIHTPDGKLHAYKAKCSHLGCTVQYQEPGNKIYCACHGGTYDPNSGKNVAGPPPKPLGLLVAEVVNGEIVIKPEAA
jgi:cytochrome b6-f complex iron-sulfur subunit